MRSPRRVSAAHDDDDENDSTRDKSAIVDAEDYNYLVTDLIKKEVFKYVAPTPPNQLIDSSVFILNFAERKFIHVGIDPVNQFNVMVHIITPSRYISINTDFLRRIFSIMGNILSYILDSPQTMKTVFLNTDEVILTNMIYRGENMLVIESKIQDGCRVLLNRKDLMTIQYIEWSLYETVVRKTKIIVPLVSQQFKQMSSYLKSCIKPGKSMTKEEITNFIKSVNDELITNNISKYEHNYVSQIKLSAVEQLSISVLTNDELKPYNDSITKNEYEVVNTSITLAKESQLCDQYDGPLRIISPLSSPEQQAVDENDGPTIFNLHYMPSPSPYSTNFYQPSQWRTSSELFSNFK